MSAQTNSDPADMEWYRQRRARREPFPPEVVKHILTGQPVAQLDPDIVGVAYTGDDATSIREQAEHLGTTPVQFISGAVRSAIITGKLSEQGYESVVRFVPPPMRLAQAMMDSAVRLWGGSVRSILSITPEE